MPSTRDFDENFMDFGVGFDSEADRVCGDCVERTDPTASAQGQTVLFKSSVVESSEDLLKTLNISSESALKYAFIGGSSKVAFALEQQYHSNSIFLSVSVQVENSTRRLRDVTLKDDARQLYASDPDRFRTRCGNQFCVSVTTGGEFYGVIEIIARDESEKRSIEGELQASGAYGPWSGSASVDFSQRLTQTLSTKTTRVMYWQRDSDDSSGPTTLAEMIQKASQFPSIIREEANAKRFRAGFMDYETLDVPAQPSPIDRERQRDVLHDLSVKYLIYRDLISEIEYVIRHPDSFADFDAAALNVTAISFRQAVNDIVRAASACYSDYHRCDLLTTLPTPIVSLPVHIGAQRAGSIHAAEAAAIKAESFAQSCGEHAQVIVGISRRIAIGPNGKQLADQAKMVVDDLKMALVSVRQAREDLVVCGLNRPDVDSYQVRVDSAFGQASEARQIALDSYPDIYAKGYAPYLNVPTVVYLRPSGGANNPYPWRSSWSADTIFWNRFDSGETAITKVAFDPSGGAIEIHPLEIDRRHTSPQDRGREWGIIGSEVGITVSDAIGTGDFFGILSYYAGEVKMTYFEVCPDAIEDAVFRRFWESGNRTLGAPIILKSTVSGLSSVVRLQLFLFEGVVRHTEYCDASWNVQGQHPMVPDRMTRMIDRSSAKS